MLGGDDNNRRGRFNRPGRFDEPDRLPWMQAVEEEETAGMGQNQKRFLLVVVAIIVVSLFTSLLFYAYNKGLNEAQNSGEPPVILANDGPSKIQPDDRGGLNVPDQERLIFNRLNEQSTQGEGADGFANSPEQPLTRPVDDGVVGDVQTAQDSNVGQSIPQAQNNTPSGAASQSAIKDPTTSYTPPITGQNPPENNRPSAMPAGSYRLQLGAFGSRRSTEIAWEQLKTRHPFPLGSLSLEVEPLTRPNSATLFRLRAGPFTSRAEADRACQSLKDNGQGCFVVAP